MSRKPDFTIARNLHFEVVNIATIDSEECFIIKVNYDDDLSRQNPEDFIIYLNIRKEDFTLQKIIYSPVDGTASGYQEFEYVNRNGCDFIVFAWDEFEPIPFDFPNFPVANTDEERTIQLAGSEQTMTQNITLLDENTMQIDLVTEALDGSYRTTQIWERGKPWWSSAKRTFTYQDPQTGETKTEIESDPVLVGVDIIPPELNLTVTPTSLWPPNHQMVEITPTISVTDNYDRFPDIKLYSVESSEPDDAVGEGDGHTTQDVQITQVWDSKQYKMIDKILLRAERDGKGSGRIYTITYTATDFSGNSSEASTTVTVPHDKK